MAKRSLSYRPLPTDGLRVYILLCSYAYQLTLATTVLSKEPRCVAKQAQCTHIELKKCWKIMKYQNDVTKKLVHSHYVMYLYIAAK